MVRAQEIVRPDGAVMTRKPVAGDMRWDGERWRRWSGRSWAHAAYSFRPDRLRDAGPLHGDPVVDEDARRRALSLAVEDQVGARGASVVHDGPSGVVLGYQQPVSHLFHAVMTLLTGGLWGLVWLAMVLKRSENRMRLEVDAWGNVWPRSVVDA